MEKLRHTAFLSIARAVAFSGLAIFVVMVGLSYDPMLALRTGGILLLLLVAGLLLKAQQIPFIDYKRTEAWILLEKSDRPDTSVASRAVPAALRQACLWFARWTAGVAALVWGVAAAWAWLHADLIPPA
jgi:hypothetical protein